MAHSLRALLISTLLLGLLGRHPVTALAANGTPPSGKVFVGNPRTKKTSPPHSWTGNLSALRSSLRKLRSFSWHDKPTTPGQIGDHRATTRGANILPDRVVHSSDLKNSPIQFIELGLLEGLWDLSLYYSSRELRRQWSAEIHALWAEIDVPRSPGFDNLHSSDSVVPVPHVHYSLDSWGKVETLLASLGTKGLLQEDDALSFAGQIVERFSGDAARSSKFREFAQRLQDTMRTHARALNGSDPIAE